MLLYYKALKIRIENISQCKTKDIILLASSLIFWILSSQITLYL